MLSQRLEAEELMDDPALDAGTYHAVLHDLAKVNRTTFAYRPTLDFLSRAIGAAPTSPESPPPRRGGVRGGGARPEGSRVRAGVEHPHPTLPLQGGGLFASASIRRSSHAPDNSDTVLGSFSDPAKFTLT